jgi:hypothetical protein
VDRNTYNGKKRYKERRQGKYKRTKNRKMKEQQGKTEGRLNYQRGKT